jgi:hypothetical protein
LAGPLRRSCAASRAPNRSFAQQVIAVKPMRGFRRSLPPFTPKTQFIWRLFRLMSAKELSRFRGSLGVPLKRMKKSEIMPALPSYARDSKAFPAWKVQFIEQNRAFYKRHRAIINKWRPVLEEFAPSFQKLEWNWKGRPARFEADNNPVPRIRNSSEAAGFCPIARCLDH